ncbi:tripartite tricarboxylate transporter substrate binding protein [Roseomonas sp. KE2513]|uniref:Bug family tripartite tricarboxylate transporter substrate binding protein n=1 Tax=Roseomonas sp. KE2513 TaxID=2479202 RepID=UPI0018DF629F|nr:tripartite tricarboxylate transporter substrate binding protein [Roseomonas sp. KE2513]
MPRLLSQLAVLALAFLLAPMPGNAQEAPYPNRPIRVLVGFAPGGGTDVTTRAMAPRLAQALGQPIVIENRPGAGGNLASEVVARAVPDGYTLLMGTIAALAVNPSLYTNLPFNPLVDLAPVSLAVTTHDLLVVHPSLPVRSVAELIALARRDRDGVACGSSGVGTAGHLSCALFNLSTGVRLSHVPYRGGGALINDLISGQVPVSFASVTTVRQYVENGTLRGLAVISGHRSPQLPDVPTVAEAGVPNYESSNWYGLVAPARTPPAVIARLNAVMREALSDPAIVTVLRQQGLEPAANSPDDFKAFIRSETEKWGRVRRAAGASAH